MKRRLVNKGKNISAWISIKERGRGGGGEEQSERKKRKEQGW